MSDSNPPSKKFLQRWRTRVEETPLWQSLVGWGTFFHNLEKVVKPAWRALQSPYVYPWVVLAFGMVGIPTATQLPNKPAPEIAAPKEAPKPEPPKSLAPAVPVEKPKVECISVTLAKMRQVITDQETAQAVLKRNYKGRLHCGWFMTVAGEPVIHSNGAWRVTLNSRDGVRVVAELDKVPALRDGDIVQVGGVIAAAAVVDDVPSILLQRAWVSRR